jgi:hypothetical protein
VYFVVGILLVTGLLIVGCICGVLASEKGQRAVAFTQKFTIGGCAAACDSSSPASSGSWQVLLADEQWNVTRLGSGEKQIGDYRKGKLVTIYSATASWSESNVRTHAQVSRLGSSWFPLPFVNGAKVVEERDLGTRFVDRMLLRQRRYILKLDYAHLQSPTSRIRHEYQEVDVDVASLANSSPYCTDALRDAFVSPVVADCTVAKGSPLGFVVSARAVLKSLRTVLTMQRTNIRLIPYKAADFGVPDHYRKL